MVPDWFLAVGLGTLKFPDDGTWKIGGVVNVYMAHLWTIPLLLVVWSGQQEHLTAKGLLKAAAAALTIFGTSEHLFHPLTMWHHTEQVKHVWGNAALYVLPAEALLGAVTLAAWHATASKGIGSKVIGAASVSIFYTGALAISYLFIEKEAWRGRVCIATEPS